MAVELEQEPAGFLNPEFIQERAQFYVDVPEGQTIIAGCSDERTETDESRALIAAAYPEALPTSEAMLRVFGSRIGMAMATIMAVRAAGRELPQHMSSITGMERAIDERMEDAHFIALNHSDAAKENSQSHLNAASNNPMGCAYANLAGTVSYLLSTNEVIRETTIAQQQAIFGGSNNTELLLAANNNLLATATEDKGKDFAVTRAMYAKETRPTLVLAGTPHFDIDKTGVIYNFTQQAASPYKAAREGKDFYSVDAFAASKKLLEVFPELHLDPQLLLESFSMLAVPVRAALELHDAGHQGAADALNPTRLRVGVYGNVQQAVTALRQIA